MSNKTYTLQQAQKLVADGAVIENDMKDLKLLNEVLSTKNLTGTYSYYLRNIAVSKRCIIKNKLIIKLSQIQPEPKKDKFPCFDGTNQLNSELPEPIPNDVLKIVEKYGDKLLTYYESLKK